MEQLQQAVNDAVKQMIDEGAIEEMSQKRIRETMENLI